ncbi:hypothetical protein LINPERPRIM_LOCUS19517, partial [Linum perenne]
MENKCSVKLVLFVALFILVIEVEGRRNLPNDICSEPVPCPKHCYCSPTGNYCICGETEDQHSLTTVNSAKKEL